ncbi:CRISPR-associated protein Cas4 [Endothiovibrio diazotrophicus]
MYPEDQLLALSGLQHLAYCPRQWALIHLEQQWGENRFTAEGELLHARAHGDEVESRGPLRIARGLRLHSHRLGLNGIADVVEFHRDPAGAPLPGSKGRWRPFPVEYKRGRAKKGDCDRVQLCAQALCLEEMLAVTIPEGALYYGKNRRRQVVRLDQSLRERTEALAAELHRLWEAGRTPPAEPGPKCDHCSLRERCLPELRGGHTVRDYLQRMLETP